MAAKTPAVLLEHYLKQLKLPAMLRDYRSIAAAAAKEKEDYTTFLLRMCERECLEREQRAAQRRIKAARFPVIKTLDTFDFAAQPTINKALVVELMRGEYLDARENILFVGNPGTGKTHLATALGHAACAQGRRVRYYSVTSLVTQLLEAREDRQLDRLLRRLEKHHLLVLDEFGYVPFTKAGAELLFEVAGRAYERQSLILTTNLPFEQWTEILGNERLTGAVHILEANGESFRLRQAKQRTKQAK